MTAKKKTTEEQIIAHYMDDVLSEESQAKSVHAFAKRHNFEESEFYNFFNGFEHLQEEIFATFGRNTIQMIEQSQEYGQYDSQQKLLSFYFTFFELLTANRSYVMAQLKDNKARVRGTGRSTGRARARRADPRRRTRSLHRARRRRPQPRRLPPRRPPRGP